MSLVVASLTHNTASLDIVHVSSLNFALILLAVETMFYVRVSNSIDMITNDDD